MTVQRTVELAVKLVDQVSATAKQMQASADDAKTSVVALETAQDSVNESIGNTRDNLTSVSEEVRRVQSSTEDAVENINSAIGTVSVPDIGADIDALKKEISDGIGTVSVPDMSSEIERIKTQVSDAIGTVDTSSIEQSVQTSLDGIDSALSETQAKIDRTVGEAKASLDTVDTSSIEQSVQTSVDRVKDEVGTAKRKIDALPSEAVSPTDRTKQKLEEVSDKARETSADVDSAMKDAQTSIMETQTRQALELATLMGIKESVGSVISGVTQLGLVSDETAQSLGKINAGFQLMAGAATGLKTLQIVMTALNTQTAINASLNTFLSVIRKPAIGAAAVGLGLGAMAGVAGMYLYTSNTSNKQVTVNVTDTANKETNQEIYRVVNGGAL